MLENGGGLLQKGEALALATTIAALMAWLEVHFSVWCRVCMAGACCRRLAAPCST